MKSKQSGFTLVEIAIVLVIIGLLLGGVLKGQAMIDNAKIKNVVNDLHSVQSAFYAYQDRFKQLPGDDLRGDTRFTGIAVKGNGNGIIAGVPNTAGTEAFYVWQHLMGAGMLKGDGTDANATAAATPPLSAMGGKLGIEHNALNLGGPAVCTSVPSTVAAGIDALLDDGVATTGDVRGAAATADQTLVTLAGVAPVAYAAPVTATPFVTICLKI